MNNKNKIKQQQQQQQQQQKELISPALQCMNYLPKGEHQMRQCKADLM